MRGVNEGLREEIERMKRKIRDEFERRIRALTHTIEFSYATHSIMSKGALTFVRMHGKLAPKPYLCFSLDGYYSLFEQPQMNYITLIYSLEYILPRTKPVLYFYPFHLRQSFEDFDAYYVQLFWETEIFTTEEIPVSDAEYQVLYRAEKPFPSIKVLPVLPDKKSSLENYAAYVLYSSRDLSLTYITDDESLKAIIDIIDAYNRSVCKLYNIDYDIAKIKAYQTLHPLYLKTLEKLKWDESPLK